MTNQLLDLGAGKVGDGIGQDHGVFCNALLTPCSVSDLDLCPGVADEIPLSIGGGIGQSRVYMLLLRKAHLGEVGVTIWPKQLRDICAERNIHVLQ